MINRVPGQSKNPGGARGLPVSAGFRGQNDGPKESENTPWRSGRFIGIA